MIKWLYGSRLKTGTENECHSPYTNDPLAAITDIGSAEGKCHIYAVSRVNPLFKEDTDAVLNGNCDDHSDQRSSPRKSISSGYESRCNSSSDSSCTECEDKREKKSLPLAKREKRWTKQSKNEKKKRGESDKDRWDSTEKSSEEDRRSSSNLKKRPPKVKSGPLTCPFVLSPIPEGKIDCSIPPPIWPRFEGKFDTLAPEVKVPARIYHNGTTNPVNFMFKYNERYPKCCSDRSKMCIEFHDKNVNGPKIQAEYEQNWVECCRNHFENCEFEEMGNKNFALDSTLRRLSVEGNDLTQEVLRDLANLIAYAMTRKTSLPWEEILENLAGSIRKSLQFHSQSAGVEGNRYDRDKNLMKVLATLLSGSKYSGPRSRTGEELKSASVDSAELMIKLEQLSGNSRKSSEGCETLDNLKGDIYSSGSEGKNSSSSSSGCKDLYMSSNSSCSAVKECPFSSNSGEFVHEMDKLYHKMNQKSEEGKKELKTEQTEGDGLHNLIHHQRDFSSSSTESAFAFSDISPPSSDSSSANGVLNPVFLHEDIYSVPKNMRNAIISESYNRTANADCAGSMRNCGNSACEKLISAKRKASHDSQLEDLGPLTYPDEEKTRLSTVVAASKVSNSVLKKVEHPYYVAIGRPDFTLDLPQAEKLMKKIASSKRRRCWCRFATSILGLLFFLLSVMMVSLVITKGRRMFGAL